MIDTSSQAAPSVVLWSTEAILPILYRGGGGHYSNGHEVHEHDSCGEDMAERTQCLIAGAMCICPRPVTDRPPPGILLAGHDFLPGQESRKSMCLVRPWQAHGPSSLRSDNFGHRVRAVPAL